MGGRLRERAVVLLAGHSGLCAPRVYPLAPLAAVRMRRYRMCARPPAGSRCVVRGVAYFALRMPQLSGRSPRPPPFDFTSVAPARGSHSCFSDARF